MKSTKWVLAAILIVCGLMMLHAQNLSGRVYYNKNILNQEINKMVKESSKDLAQIEKEAIEKEEKEKGRKLTDKEKATIKEKVAEGKKMMQALSDGVKAEITLTFKHDKKAVMKTDMSVSEDALKLAGIGWAKRKMLKMATAVANTSEKVTYTVKGNQILFQDSKGEKDTLTLSGDGKSIYGVEDKVKYTLTRIK